jgi:hypothetical protein
VQDFSSLALRFLVAVDVEGYSQRPASGQASAQGDLERAITKAATAVGLDRGHWYRVCGSA